MRGFGERLHFFIRPICRFCDTVSVCRDYHRSKRPPFLRSESREKFCWVGGCYESFLSQPSEDSVFRHCRRHRCLLLSVLVAGPVRAVFLRLGADACGVRQSSIASVRSATVTIESIIDSEAVCLLASIVGAALSTLIWKNTSLGRLCFETRLPSATCEVRFEKRRPPWKTFFLLHASKPG